MIRAFAMLAVALGISAYPARALYSGTPNGIGLEGSGRAVTSAITALGQPFSLGINSGFDGDSNGFVQVLENGVAVPGCEHLSDWSWSGDLNPVYFNQTRCALPAPNLGWHVFDVIAPATAYSPTVSRQFPLYVAEGPLPTSVGITPLGGYLGTGYLQFTVQVRRPSDPAFPSEPDLTQLSDGQPPGVLTITLDGHPLACGPQTPAGQYRCSIRTTRGRHTLAARFTGLPYFQNSQASLDFDFPSVVDDYNRDGKADIFWRNGAGRTAVWFMDGATQIGAGDLWSAGSGWNIGLLGANAGRYIFVAVHDNGSVGVAATLLRGAGNQWVPKLAGDFDGDGFVDLVWEHPTLGVEMSLLDANGAIKASRTLISGGTGWHPVLAGDFDGSGSDDLLWQRDDGAVAMWTMNGLTQIGAATLIAPGTGWSPAFVAAFDGDRYADILWTHADGRVAMWTMTGTKQAGGALLLPAGTGYTPILVSDLDGDQKADIVWERTDGRTAFWTMDGTRQVGGGEVFASGSGWKALRLADYNGDGRFDILAQHKDGRASVGLYDGLRTFAMTTILPAGTGFRPVTPP